jgi:hypothetical protein
LTCVATRITADADDLAVGDMSVGADQGWLVVGVVDDLGSVASQVIFDLSVGTPAPTTSALAQVRVFSYRTAVDVSYTMTSRKR